MEGAEAIVARLAELEARLQGHADVLAQMADLSSQVHQVSELLAEVVVKVGLDDDKPGRMPRPTPQWHKLTKEELAAELMKLRGYEKEILPLLGHMAKLGTCWPKHPLCCIVMDVFGEIWQTLFMGERRPPAILMGQADFLIRVAPGLLQLAAKETSQCDHAAYPSSVSRGQ